MGLDTRIKPELWASLERSYSSGNYTHAIQDAMSFVTDTIRDKSGLDGDGDSLVGQALGFGKNKRPKLMINRFQTQTEKDMQRGIMLVLKGLYALVRNPRSHERIEDSSNNADAIIQFIDYLTDFLGASQQSFTVQSFLSKVTDAYFVPDTEYVNSLIDSIPAIKRTDTLISLYRILNWKQADNFEIVIKQLLVRLNEAEQRDFLAVVSENLQRTEHVSDVTLLIKVLPPGTWSKLDRMPRLRAENMLIDELNGAWYIPDTGQTSSTAATWINGIAAQYLRKENLRRVILSNLREEDFDKHNFIAQFLMLFNVLPNIFETSSDVRNLINAISSSIRSGNVFMKDSLIRYTNEGSPLDWLEIIREELKDLTDTDNPQYYLPDGTPFLGKFVEKPNPAGDEQMLSSVDDIPF